MTTQGGWRHRASTATGKVCGRKGEGREGPEKRGVDATRRMMSDGPGDKGWLATMAIEVAKRLQEWEQGQRVRTARKGRK